jgi:tryptophan synthase beta subunit
MKSAMQGRIDLHFEPPLQKYFGKYGGFFVPDPFTPALEALAEAFTAAAKGSELTMAINEAAQLMGIESVSLGMPETVGRSRCYIIPSKVQQYLAAGYAGLGKVLGRRLACGVCDRKLALAIAALAKTWDLKTSIWLDRDLGNDPSLVADLQKKSLEVDIEKTRDLFDDPTMYAFQRYIADPQTNLFVPLATNVGPYPFPGISAAFAALFGDGVRLAVEASPGLKPLAYVAPGRPGTDMLAILRATKPGTRLITYETPWETEREDCYCGAYTRVVQKASKEQVLSPELVAAWEAGKVQRVQAKDARTAVRDLDLSGDVILIEES